MNIILKNIEILEGIKANTIIIKVKSLIRTEILYKYLNNKPSLIYTTLKAPKQIYLYKLSKRKNIIKLELITKDLNFNYMDFITQYLEYLNNIKLSELVELEFQEVKA